MHHIDKITLLLKRHFVGSGNIEADKKEIMELLERHPELNQLLDEFKNPELAGKIFREYNDLDISNQNLVLESILERINKKPSKRTSIYKISLYAAACAALIIGFYFFNRTTTKEINSEIIAENIVAGEKGAILRLADGTSIELSSDKEGIVSGEDLRYEDGSKLLDGNALEANKLLSLVIPNGKEFQVTLSDGTKVFLNAGSELTYPARFTGTSRDVVVKGEAYFDIAKNTKMPFRVKTQTQTIEVLGTQFNVNEYSKSSSSVTLVEGKVAISVPNQNDVILSPNQHATNTNGKIAVKNVDVSEYIAWKNGEFVCNYESVSDALENIKRWYDIEIEIAPAVDSIQLWSSIKRKEDFAEILELIKLTNQNLKIDIKGRKVTVTR